MIWSAQDQGDNLDLTALYWNNNGYIYLICYKDGVAKYNAEFTSAPSLTVGGWYNLVIVQDGVSPDLYVNGIKYDLAGAGDQTCFFDEVTNMDLFTIGARISLDTLIQPFNGTIDEVTIYNRSL